MKIRANTIKIILLIILQIFVVYVLFNLILVGLIYHFVVPKVDEFFSQPSRTDLALEALEEKYGESFAFESSIGADTSGVFSIYVTCESMPNKRIKVGKEYSYEPYTDNYLAVKYEDETKNYLYNSITEYFSDVRIFYDASTSGTISPEVPIDISFEEFLSSPTGPHHLIIEVKESAFTSREDAEKFAKKLENTGLTYFLSIIVIEDHIYGTLSKDELSKKMGYREFVECLKVGKEPEREQYYLEWLEN